MVTMKKTAQKILSLLRDGGGYIVTLFVVCLLCTGFFCGMISLVPAMKNTADSFYDSQQFWDFNIHSTLGFTADDVLAVSAIRETDRVQGVISTDTSAWVNGTYSKTARIIGVDFDALETNSSKLMAAPKLIKGSYPVNRNSCLAVVSSTEKGEISVGDIITLDNPDDVYKETRYTVTGIVVSPDFISLSEEKSTTANGRVEMAFYVPLDSYNDNSTYTNLYVTLDGAEDLNTFSKQYSLLTDSVKVKLQELASSRETARVEGMNDEYTSSLDKLKKQIEYEINLAESQLETSLDALNDLKNQINSLEKAIEKEEKSLSELKKKLDAQSAEIETLKKLEGAGLLNNEQKAKLETYEKSQADYSKRETELKADKNALTVSEKNYEISQKEYNSDKKETEKKVKEAKKQLEEIEQGIVPEYSQSWTISDRSSNAGFTSFSGIINRATVISVMLPLLLFSAGVVLAAYALVRMLRRHRKEIGAQMAMGYTNRQISAKYWHSAVLTALLSAASGAFLGFVYLPNAVYDSYRAYYVFSDLQLSFPVVPAIVCIVLVVLVVAAVIAVVLRAELQKTPAMLIGGREIAHGKILFLENRPQIWNKIPFALRTAIKNVLLYKKRLITALVGIGISTALLLASFGIQNAVQPILNAQYSKIITHNLYISLVSGAGTNDEMLSGFLQDTGRVEGYLPVFSETGAVVSENPQSFVEIYVPLERENVSNFVNLKTSALGRKISFAENAVVVTEGFARQNGIRKGSVITIQNSAGDKVETPVTAICKNYVGDYIYISPERYNTLFSTEVAANTLWVKSYDVSATEESTKTELLQSSAVADVTFSSSLSQKASDVSSRADFAKILKYCALSFLVLTLCFVVSQFFTERAGELTSMRTMGYSTSEMLRYILQENILLTAVCLAVGFIVGGVVNALTVFSLEIPGMIYARGISAMAALKTAGTVLGLCILVTAFLFSLNHSKNDK